MGFKSKPLYERTYPSNVFGDIPGVPVGSTFENRLYLHHTAVHANIQAGINGSKDEGCYSVVLSGGYEDDKDEGDRFTYTGCGGRDKADGEKPRDGPQTCDQTFDNSRNQSLRLSAHNKRPVRVIRGYNSDSDYAPLEGFRYDGLYEVEQPFPQAWMATGKSGFKVCKFILSRLPNQRPIPRRFQPIPLDVDLSQWEEPQHFWGNCAGPDHSGSGQRDGPRLPRLNERRKAQERTNASAGPSRPPALVQRPPPSPIPPTTNSALARARHTAAQAQTSTDAPVFSVDDILAEWSAPRGVHRPPAPTQAPSAAYKSSASASSHLPPRLNGSLLHNATGPPRRPFVTLPGAAAHPLAAETSLPRSPGPVPVVRRTRPADTVVDDNDFEALKRAKVAPGLDVEGSPTKSPLQRACSRPPLTTQSLKQEKSTSVPRSGGDESSVIDLTFSDEEDVWIID
ncbi:PUA-like domain-containing protein [Dichomitus squalens]|uniref:PUA-like domain-containing protein n=1 Tax=Dichomitus squalens TaxID=114155 RepID=A0A4Q9PKS8_9APHY|nr:PUA-like domain-containing protein [Dichomitus squalens]TBU54751.1 PUA-like domain-containing protein [Dichomitus squalens]